MKTKKIILPVSILLASIILGGFYYASQVSKQNSIEKQQIVKIEEEKRKAEEKATKEGEEKKSVEEEKRLNKIALEICLETADTGYWAYVKLNGTEKKDGTVYADNDVWDRAEKVKQSEISNCYRKHPQQ